MSIKEQLKNPSGSDYVVTKSMFLKIIQEVLKSYDLLVLEKNYKELNIPEEVKPLLV